MHRREVLASGWEQGPPRCEGIAVRVVSLPALQHAMARSPFAVVLLGEGALRSLDPAAVAKWGPMCLLLGVLPRRDDRLILRWGRSTSLASIGESDIQARLREAVDRPVRPFIPPEKWLYFPPRPTSHGPPP